MRLHSWMPLLLSLIAILLWLPATADDFHAAATTASTDENLAALKRRVEELERLVEELKCRLKNIESKQHQSNEADGRTSLLLLGTRNERRARFASGNIALLRHAAIGTSLYHNKNDSAAAEQTEGKLAQAAGAFGGAGLWQAMNPDISVIGDFVIRLGGKNPFSSYHGSALRTVELALQAYTDPFGRLDAFIEHSSEGVHVCQAELTLLDPKILRLPKGLQLRGGILLTNIGKLNMIHAHEQPLADLPLLYQFFYSHPPEDNPSPTTYELLNHIIEHGGHNFHGAGARLSYLLPTENPRQAHEISFEALNSHNLTFDCGRGRPLLLLRWRSFFEVTPIERTLDLGLNCAYGPNPFGGDTRLYSVDLTYRWRPIERGIYRSLAWYNEFAIARRSGNGSSRSATGFFSMIEYQLSRTLYLGARYDWSSLPDSSAHGSGASFALTYYPSEFSRYRLQINRRRYSLLGSSWDLLLEMTFSIGIHRPHPF